MSVFDNILKQALAKNNISLTDEQIWQLIAFLELLLDWNRVYNLTTITEPSEMVFLHIIDSLVIGPYLQGARFLDVGSGGGLPGIPLAIRYPEKTFVLLDKNNKKTRFLIQAVAQLGLKNVEVVHTRCENYQPERCFDSIISRAFGSIGLFLETTRHLLCNNGIWVAMKGQFPTEELKGLPSPYHIVKTQELDIKGVDILRHVICVTKNKEDESWVK